MRIRRLLGAVLAMPVLTGGLVLVTAGPVAACTCAQMTEAQHAASVDAVFVGRLVGSRVDPSVWTPKYREEKKHREQVERSGLPREVGPVVLTFEVSRVYKGPVGKRQEIVISPVAGPGWIDTCRFYVPAGPGPWLVFAGKSSGDTFQLDDGQYLSAFSTVCIGSRALPDGSEPALGGLPAHEPDGRASSPSSTRGGLSAGGPGGPASSPSPAKASPSGLVATRTSRSGAHSTATVSLVGVGVLAVGVVAGLGLAILRARRRASAD